MCQGWIKVHRELIKKPIWLKSTPEQKAILITILLMANHEESEWEWEGQKFKVQPGQFVTSLESIAKAAGVSIQNVRTAILKFEKYEFLTNKSTKTGRLITIVNWNIYQSQDIENNKAINKEVTKTQQRPNKDLTTNKNDKNDKNDKKNKIIYAEYVSMTEDEYNKLIKQYGEENTKLMITTLNNYKGANGKKYKSDYLAILNWVVERVMKNKGGGNGGQYKSDNQQIHRKYQIPTKEPREYTDEDLEQLGIK